MPRYEQEADRSPSSPLYTPKHIAAIKKAHVTRDLDGAYRAFGRLDKDLEQRKEAA